jgi:hypothetical protein
MSSSEWGITRRVPAQVDLADNTHLGGELHLLARTTYPPGPETVLEMLNRPEAFFALTVAEHDVALVAKAQAAVVACRDEIALLDPDRASVAKAVRLAVELYGGGVYQGSATFELPPTSSRVLDYLNAPGAFFALSDGDTVRYVNKSLVRLIRPRD